VGQPLAVHDQGLPTTGLAPSAGAGHDPPITFRLPNRVAAMPPSLTHIADIRVLIAAPIAVGETTEGLRRVIPIIGGTINGARLNGTVMAAGADYQVIRADGYTTLDARYVVRLDDGALVYVVNTGVRFGPPDVMARITRGEIVDPSEVYFRTTPRFETASAEYQWLTRPLFLASAARHPTHVEITVFEVG
jgi:hypothetical protein